MKRQSKEILRFFLNLPYFIGVSVGDWIHVIQVIAFQNFIKFYDFFDIFLWYFIDIAIKAVIKGFITVKNLVKIFLKI